MSENAQTVEFLMKLDTGKRIPIDDDDLNYLDDSFFFWLNRPIMTEHQHSFSVQFQIYKRPLENPLCKAFGYGNHWFLIITISDDESDPIQIFTDLGRPLDPKDAKLVPFFGRFNSTSSSVTIR